MQFVKKRHSDFLNQTKAFLDLQKKLMTSSSVSLIVAFSGVFYLFIRSSNQVSDPVFVWMLGIASFLMIVNLILCYVTLKTQRMSLQARKRSEASSPDGLVSISFFDEMLEEEVRRANRYHYPLTLCKLILDDHKSIEENFGKKQAAEHLGIFARLMKGSIRESDRIVRYGQREFCVLLPHTDMVEAEKFISRILKLSSDKADCSFCAGLTPYRSGENKVEFSMRADSALEHAQKEGKSKVCCVIGKDDHQMVVQF